ncbi:MAG TPA: hypothetical protein VJH90_01210 [archaeon]|nr:hypothetical protein [archaeon]
MMEITIDKKEWKFSRSRFQEISKLLRQNGWISFGTNGLRVFFKDMRKYPAEEELKGLGIEEIEAVEWERIEEARLKLQESS